LCADDLPWNLLADVYGYTASAALLPGAEEVAAVESSLQALPSDRHQLEKNNVQLCLSSETAPM